MTVRYGAIDIVAAKELISDLYGNSFPPTFDESMIPRGNDAQLVALHLAQAQLAVGLGLVPGSERHLWDRALGYVAHSSQYGWDPREAYFWWQYRYPDQEWPLMADYQDEVDPEPVDVDG